MEVVGYVARVISAKHVSEKSPYRLQLVIIVLAPVVMAAVIYVVFSRIIHWVVPPELRTFKLLWIPRRCIKRPRGRQAGVRKGVARLTTHCSRSAVDHDHLRRVRYCCSGAAAGGRGHHLRSQPRRCQRAEK